MIGDFINRMRPEPWLNPEDRPADAPETVADGPSYAGAAPEGAGPIEAARIDPDRAAEERRDAAVQAERRKTRLAEEGRAVARSPEPDAPVTTDRVTPEPVAEDRPVVAAATASDRRAEAAPAVPETEAPEDTHPEADVAGYDLGTADWRYSRADTRRRLPREETDTLICSAKVEGTAVYDPDGKKLGRVESVMLHKTAGRVEYAVVRLPGGLVSGETYRPVPWADLRYDEAAGGYQIDADRQALKRDRSFEEGR